MSKELEIIITPNKVLRQEAREVPSDSIKTPKIQNLILNMKETLKKTLNGVGLAASQVGESLRIFIVSEEAEEIDKVKNQRWEEKREEWKRSNTKPYEEKEWKYYVFINPMVKKISKKKLEGPEGCLSVPEKFGLVKRAEKITVKAYDEKGTKFTRGFTKFFARVIQHELDHLNGALFIDKAEKMLESSLRDKTMIEEV